jgi:hypothetical protein
MHRLLFPITLLLVTGGCSFRANSEAAETASTTFHQQMSAEQYEAIYDGATSAFKAAIGRETFSGLCKRIRRKMGTCQAASLTSSGFQTVPQGSFINLTYKRQCDNGTLAEQFVWQMISGKAVLNAFHADNPLLVTD